MMALLERTDRSFVSVRLRVYLMGASDSVDEPDSAVEIGTAQNQRREAKQLLTNPSLEQQPDRRLLCASQRAAAPARIADLLAPGCP
jgi:hypothetical protein